MAMCMMRVSLFDVRVAVVLRWLVIACLVGKVCCVCGSCVRWLIRPMRPKACSSDDSRVPQGSAYVST